MEDEAMSQCSIVTFSQISPADSEGKELWKLYKKLYRKRCTRTYLAGCYSNEIQSQEGKIKDRKLKIAEAGKKRSARVRENEDLQKLRKEYEVKIEHAKTAVAKGEAKAQEKAKKLLAVREHVQQIHETCDNTLKAAQTFEKQIKEDKPDPLVMKHRELRKKLFETTDHLKLLLSDPKNQNVISNGYDMLVVQIDEYLSEAKDKDEEKCGENPYFFDETRVVKILTQSKNPFFDELENVGINCFKEEEKSGKRTIDQNQMQSEVININKVEPTIETGNAKSSSPLDVQFSNGNVTAATLCDQTTDNPTLDNYPRQSSSGKIMKIPTSKMSSEEKIDKGLDSVALRNAETSTAHIAQRSSQDSLSMQDYRRKKDKHIFDNKENDKQSIRSKKTRDHSVNTFQMFTRRPESNKEDEMGQKLSMLMLNKPMYDRTNTMESPAYGLKQEEIIRRSDKQCKQEIDGKQLQMMEVAEDMVDPKDSMMDNFQPIITKTPENNIYASTRLVEPTHESSHSSELHKEHLQSFQCSEASDSPRFYSTYIISTAAPGYELEENAPKFPHGKFPDDAESLFQFKKQLKEWKPCASEPPCRPPEPFPAPVRFNSECQLPAEISPSKPQILRNGSCLKPIISDNIASSSMAQDLVNIKSFWHIDSSAGRSDICSPISVSKSKKQARKIQTLPYQSASRASHRSKEKKLDNFHIALTEFLQSKLYGDEGTIEEKTSKYKKNVREGLQDNIETEDKAGTMNPSAYLRYNSENVNMTTANDPIVLQELLSCKLQTHNIADSDVDRNIHSLEIESGGLLNNFDSSKHSTKQEFYHARDYSSDRKDLAQNSEPAPICVSLLSDSNRNSESPCSIEKNFIVSSKVFTDQINLLADHIEPSLLSAHRKNTEKETYGHTNISSSVSHELVVLDSDDEEPAACSPQRFRKLRLSQPTFDIEEEYATICHSPIKEKVEKKPLQSLCQGKKQNHSRKMISTDFLQFQYPGFDNQRDIGEMDHKQDMANTSCHITAAVDKDIKTVDVRDIQSCVSKQSKSEIAIKSPYCQLDECKPTLQSKEVSNPISIFPDSDQGSKLNFSFDTSEQIGSGLFSKNIFSPDNDDYLMELICDNDSPVCRSSIASDNFNPIHSYSAENAIVDMASPLNARNNPKKSETYVPFDFEKYMKPMSGSPESPPTPFQMPSRSMFSNKDTVPEFSSRKKEGVKTVAFQTIEEIMKKTLSVASSSNVEKQLDTSDISVTSQKPKEMSMQSEFFQGFSKQK